jgi:hypothetical protein
VQCLEEIILIVMSKDFEAFTVRGVQIFQKCRSHLQILGTRRVRFSKFCTEDPQFLNELSTSLLSGTFGLMHVK